MSGGRVGAVTGTDADSSLYYAGAAGGGVWKTIDGAQTWQPVFDKEDVAQKRSDYDAGGAGDR